MDGIVFTYFEIHGQGNKNIITQIIPLKLFHSLAIPLLRTMCCLVTLHLIMQLRDLMNPPPSTRPLGSFTPA